MTLTSTRCTNCSAVLPPGIRFCPECGRSTAPRSSNPLPWIVGGIVGLALIVLLILLMRPQAPPVTGGQPGKVDGPPVVGGAPRLPDGPPVAGAPTPPPGPPVVGAPTAPPQPEDPNRIAVAAYLAKMAEIERRRKEAINNLYPAMLTMAMLKSMGGMQDMLQMLDEDVSQEQKEQTQPSSVQKAEDTMQQYRDQFRALEMEVQKIQPPAPAQRFHTGYTISLRSYDAVVGEIQNAMLAGDQSIGGRGGELKSRVANILKATDDEMGRLLTRYSLPRTFSVSDDQAGSITTLTP